MTLSEPQLEQVWSSAGGSTGTGQTPLASIMAWIALGESGGDSTAYNANDTNGLGGTQVSAGLWQISNGTSTPVANWSDPVTNGQYAVQKLSSQGFGAWGLPSNLGTMDPETAFSTIDARYQGRVSSALGGASAPSSTASTVTAPVQPNNVLTYIAQSSTNVFQLFDNFILSAKVDILTKALVACFLLVLLACIQQTQKFAGYAAAILLFLLLVQKNTTATVSPLSPTNTGV